MSYQLNTLLASEHAADLRRAADNYRLGLAATEASENTAVEPIVLRLAGEQDEPALRLLAELDEAPVPAGPILLALVGGEVISALSLSDGSVIANPFARTLDAVALLKMRADHLSGTRRGRRWRVIPRLRLA